MSNETRPQPKRPSMRKAINDMCKYCIYDETSTGTWRQQVEACTSPTCPLYSLRPVSYLPRPDKKVEKVDADING